MYAQRRGIYKRRAQEELVLMGGWYLLVLFALLVGITCGWALPSYLQEGERQLISQQAGNLLSQAVSPNQSLFMTICVALWNALRTVGLLFLASLTPYLSICAGIAMWAKGFGIGFTLHGMQLAHGFGGLFLAFVMLALQNCLYLPSYAYIAVHGGRIQGYESTSLGGRAMLFLLRYRWCLAAIAMGIMVECIISPLLLRTVYGWVF